MAIRRRPQVGRPLTGAEPAGPDDDGPLLCFHAATRRGDGGVATAGGRVATFVGLGDDLPAARATAYAGVGAASLEGGQLRHDIAAREVETPS